MISDALFGTVIILATRKNIVCIIDEGRRIILAMRKKIARVIEDFSISYEVSIMMEKYNIMCCLELCSSGV